MTDTQTHALSGTVLESLRGELLDLDSHLMVPMDRFPKAFGTFGKVVGPVATSLIKRFSKDAAKWEADQHEVPFDDDAVWNVKGASAPGGADAETRVRALDVMGVRRQLVFPDVLSAFITWGKEPWAPGAMRAHNDYALEWAADSGGRLVPAAVLNTRKLEVAVAEAERLAEKGARAAMVADAILPGGMSPAHPDVDRLWKVLSDAGIAVLLHVGGQHGFASGKWERTDLLKTRPQNLGSEGDPIGPLTLATMHLSPVNYLSTLIFGGVLERFPDLKIGVMELGAMWVGPMVELLDNRALFSNRITQALSLKPSEYLRRSVRVTPFYQEPVGEIIDRYGLDDVLCYASDFPHREGGTDPIGATLASLQGHSAEVVEKFFVTNGRLILGD
jgi:predicted TIM-barrel fold metal-dependent hydrolase